VPSNAPLAHLSKEIAEEFLVKKIVLAQNKAACDPLPRVREAALELIMWYANLEGSPTAHPANKTWERNYCAIMTRLYPKPKKRVLSAAAAAAAAENEAATSAVAAAVDTVKSLEFSGGDSDGVDAEPPHKLARVLATSPVPAPTSSPVPAPASSSVPAPTSSHALPTNLAQVPSQTSAPVSALVCMAFLRAPMNAHPLLRALFLPGSR
jgi:hypothetical protein